MAVKGLDSGVNPDSFVFEVGAGVIEHMGVSSSEEDVVGNKDSADIVEFDSVCCAALLEPGFDDSIGAGEMHLHEEPIVLVQGGEFFLSEDDLIVSLIGDLQEKRAFSGIELGDVVSWGVDVGSLLEGIGDDLSLFSVEASGGIKLDPKAETVV